jgi:hypothetical protein
MSTFPGSEIPMGLTSIKNNVNALKTSFYSIILIFINPDFLAYYIIFTVVCLT